MTDLGNHPPAVHDGTTSRSAVKPSTSWLARLTVVVLAASGLTVTGIVTAPPAQADPNSTDGVAATEADALAEAAETGDPVEVLAARTETRDVFANADGSFTANEHTAAIRTFDDGAWVDIDTSLSENNDGSISPANTTVDLRFSGGGDTALIEATDNDRSMGLDWTTELPAPTLDGDTATYPEVMPDVDLLVTALPDGFTHTLIVKTAEAAANPDLDAIDMPIQLDGTTVSETADGGVAVGDSAGGVLMEAAPPAMWDSSDQRATVTATVDDDSVTLEPDQELLDDPQTEYPVAIDPVYRDNSRSRWAMVNSGYPTESYYKFDGSEHEGLGYCGFGNCNNTQIRRLLYKVSTSAYENKDILDAEFAVTVQHYAYSGESHKVDLYKMREGITSGTDWNSKKDEWTNRIDTRSGPGAASSGCSNSSSYAMEFDVESEVAAAADNGTSSLTFGLRNDNESSFTKWMRMCDNGTLRVKYNTPPAQPDMDTMGMSPGKACSYDLGTDAYTNKPPTLFGTLEDADHGDRNEWGGDDGERVSEELSAEFKLIWDGGEWLSEPSAANAAGSQFSLDLSTIANPPTLPENTPIGWILRADDGESQGPWSWTGDATRCRFIIDPTAPAPPEVTSTDFPDGNTVTPGVGEIGELTVDTADDDVKSYEVDFNKDDAGPVTLTPDQLGGAVTASFMPRVPGRQLMTVNALDAAGNGSTNVYSFRVSAPKPAASYDLSDPAGSTTIADADGSNPGTPGSSVTLGVPGPGATTAAEFDGSPDAYVSTQARAVVPTSEGFAASAWVKIDDLSRDQTIVSVNGGLEAGFRLGYDSTSATGGRWILEIPEAPQFPFHYWRVTGGTVTETNHDQWVHVAGVYDPSDEKIRLYLNGNQVGEESFTVPWYGDGEIQLGRSQADGAYTYHLDGALAEVRLFDRVVVADEADYLATVIPRRAAYWQLNADGAEYTGKAALILSGGASIYNKTDPFGPKPVLGDGHLELDGESGYANTGDSLIDTELSFSVTTKVRPSSAMPGRDMTVFALPGDNTNLVEVKYSVDADAWRLVIAKSDSATAETITVDHYIDPSASPQGQAVSLTYDAFTGQLVLWVNGQPSEPLLDPVTDFWPTSGIQLGRAGAGEGYFSGAIDDVRVYSGSCYPSMITDLAGTKELPDL